MNRDGFNRYNGSDICPVSVSRTHDARRDGTCRWRERRCAYPVARPKPVRVVSVLDDAYRYMWDPDYGLTP
jgi:hypothetical protein